MRADTLLPNPAPGPGTPLWGAPPRRQPVVPMIALAFVTLLVCAPAALSSNGQSSNPITLLRETAIATYEMTQLIDVSNERLAKINDNTAPLKELAVNMERIGSSTEGMNGKTTQLADKLGGVGENVAGQRTKLARVDRNLAATSRTMGAKRTALNGSLRSTRSIVRQFRSIDRSIGAMDAGLAEVISLMAKSTPQTRAFAENTTRKSIAGGEGHKYGVVNIAAGSRVMSVMLPMIQTMQQGGPLASRKDGAEASNPLVGTLLARQVPNGTNVNALVQPFDGRFGMPGADYFVTTPVNGF